MEFNWSTFLLEILNFLVLVWILKRFFYRPVLDAVARRKQNIEQTVASAEAIRTEAQALQSQYETRLSQWNEERESAREDLRREIANDRERLMAALGQELAEEREKARVLDEKMHADLLRKFQEFSLIQGARFVAKLLSAVANPDLENSLIGLALDQLDALPEERLNAIRLACEETPEEAQVATAYMLDLKHRQRLERKLGELVGMPVVCHFSEDRSLLAGVRVTLGPWVFRCNLQDELKGFAESAHEPD